MDYYEVKSILNAFNEQNRQIFFYEHLTGVDISIERDKHGTEEYVVNVRLSQLPDKSPNTSYLKLGLRETFVLDDREYRVAIHLSELPRAQQVEVGTAAWGEGLNGYGTYGWAFWLDGRPTALSNWHVFCASGNQTELGTAVFLGGNPRASLSYFEPIHAPGANTFDLALATITDPNELRDHFKVCEDGHRFPYPYKMEFKPRLGADYYKVGARSPFCRKGTLKNIGSRRVRYDHGIFYFQDQLIFSQMSDPGDSGSIIVNSESNQIAGLCFAGGNGETIANPLFLKGWQYQGRKALGDIELPQYTSTLTTIANNRAGELGLVAPDTGVPPSFGGVNRIFVPIKFADYIARVPEYIRTMDILEAHGNWIRISNIRPFPGQEALRGVWLNTNAPEYVYEERSQWGS